MEMIMTRRGRAIAGLAGAAAAGSALAAILVSGVLTSATASQDTPHSVKHEAVASPDPTPSAVSYARDALGLTYGSELQASSPAQAPDLISAIATNGKLGYVKKTDLYPAGPSNPQQALSRQQSDKSQTSSIPVYAVDGTTQIGVYEIQAGGPAN